MLALIDDILDLGRIEAGNMDIQAELFAPAEMAEKLASEVSALAEQKDLRFVVTVDPQLPKYLVGDRSRIEQVVLNLLSNAFKFTEHGEVEFRLSALPAAQKYMLQVRDTGIGIPPMLRNTFLRIFGKSMAHREEPMAEAAWGWPFVGTSAN